MTGISHFQTYSQRENHVTNNTLLMLRHVYRSSSLRLQEALNALLGADVEVGPRFEQQRRGAHSIPDAVIEQAPFHLYVEAKLDSDLRPDQLQKHLRSIAETKPGEGAAFLLGLTRNRADERLVDEVETAAQALGVQFAVTTYAELLATLEEACAGDIQLKEILQDYRSFLAGADLLPDQHRRVVAFLCGTSWRENVATGVYYEPADRNAKWLQAHIIGVYAKKRVSHVGRIRKVAICKLAEATGRGAGLEVVAEELGELDQEDRTAILTAIERGKDHFPGLADEPHRFYLVDRFVETELRKASPGGMMNFRYFDLADYGIDVAPDTPIEAIAQGLKGREFS